MSVLTMFFDSLDEGLLQLRNIAAVLSSEPKNLPAQRLRIRIACRTYDWQVGLESTLIEIFGDKNFGIFELAPLRRVDVITSARSEGIDAALFLAAVDGVGAVPFAIKPISLLFLLNSFKKDGALPSSVLSQSNDYYGRIVISMCRSLPNRSSYPSNSVAT
jgi:hypothetical protein